MDALKLLQVEYDGIRGTIESYTDESNITNNVNQLREAIQMVDIELIKYQLSRISDWYENAMPSIANNRFVSKLELDSHIENKALIVKLIQMFEDYHVTESEYAKTSQNVANGEPGSPTVFISHRSSDKKYGDALRNFIIGLGVRDDQLIYTSHPLHKIPLDKNIYDYLRENINGRIFMIILWSNEYLESPACLNEMGAAWVAQSDYTNIYTPNFSFGNPKYRECAVDTRKMGAVLKNDDHCRTSMIELKDKIQKKFNLPNDEKKTAYLLEKFMKEIGD